MIQIFSRLKKIKCLILISTLFTKTITATERYQTIPQASASDLRKKSKTTNLPVKNSQKIKNSKTRSIKEQSSLSQKIGPKTLLQEIKDIQKQINMYTQITFEFEQKVYKSLRKKFTNSKGKALFHKPNHFRWEFINPHKDTWTFNGISFFHIKHETKSYELYSSEHQVGKELLKIVEIIFSSESLLKDYRLLTAKREKNLFLNIRLSPKQKSDMKALELKYHLKNKFIDSIKLEWKRGENYTLINIQKSELKKAKTIKEKLVFLPPASYSKKN